MYSCRTVLVSRNNDLINILTFLCQESHKLTNMGTYLARQLYFKTKKIIGKYDLEKAYKTNNHYRVLYSQAAQQTLRSVAESFASYKKLVRAYKQGELTDRPRIPNYRKKGGLATVSYPKQALKLKDGQVKVPLGRTFKRWFGSDRFLDGVYLPKHGEKPKDWKPSGRRTKRGLYTTANNWYINADCNGAGNIGTKVSRTLELVLDRRIFGRFDSSPKGFS